MINTVVVTVCNDAWLGETCNDRYFTEEILGIEDCCEYMHEIDIEAAHTRTSTTSNFDLPNSTS